MLVLQWFANKIMLGVLQPDFLVKHGFTCSAEHFWKYLHNIGPLHNWHGLKKKKKKKKKKSTLNIHTMPASQILQNAATFPTRAWKEVFSKILGI